MPTHNRAKIISKSLRCILKQTYTNYELLVVLDGCTDNTSDVVNRFGDERFRIFKTRKRSGPGAARNLGFKYASGKYIAYCDDDDLFYADHLDLLVNALEPDPKIGLSYGDCYIIKDGEKGLFSPEHRRSDLECGNYIYPSVVIHRKSCLDRVGLFDERLQVFEDWELFLRISDRYRFRHVKKVIGERIVHEKNYSSVYNAITKSFVYVYNKRIQLAIAERKKRKLGYFKEVYRILGNRGAIDEARRIAMHYYSQHPSEGLRKLIGIQ